MVLEEYVWIQVDNLALLSQKLTKRAALRYTLVSRHSGQIH